MSGRAQKSSSGSSSASASGGSNSKYAVFVKNLPANFSNQDLKRLFAAQQPTDARVMTDRDFGFVDLPTQAAMEAALARDKEVVPGFTRPLHVERTKGKSQEAAQPSSSSSSSAAPRGEAVKREPVGTSSAARATATPASHSAPLPSSSSSSSVWGSGAPSAAAAAAAAPPPAGASATGKKTLSFASAAAHLREPPVPVPNPTPGPLPIGASSGSAAALTSSAPPTVAAAAAATTTTTATATAPAPVPTSAAAAGAAPVLAPVSAPILGGAPRNTPFPASIRLASSSSLPGVGKALGSLALASSVTSGPSSSPRSDLPSAPRPSVTVAVYFGTFDPVHENHIAVARYAIDRWNVHTVVFAPNSDNEIKHQSTLHTHRVQLLTARLACEDCAKQMTIFDTGKRIMDWQGRADIAREIRTEYGLKLNATVDVVQLLGQDKFQETGSQMALSRPSTYNFLHRRLLIFPRDGYEDSLVVPPHLDGKATVAMGYKDPVQYSSTAAREAMFAGETPIGIHPSVLAEIHRLGLYRLILPSTRETVIVVAGAHGSGKSTLGKRIAKEFGMVHFSIGEAYRRAKENPAFVALHEKYHDDKFAQMKLNGLLDYALVELRRLLGGRCCRFVLDGPNEGSAESLEEIYDGNCMDLLVYLECSDDTLRSRMQSRERDGETKEDIEKRIRKFHEHQGLLGKRIKSLLSSGRRVKVMHVNVEPSLDEYFGEDSELRKEISRILSTKKEAPLAPKDATEATSADSTAAAAAAAAPFVGTPPSEAELDELLPRAIEIALKSEDVAKFIVRVEARIAERRAAGNFGRDRGRNYHYQHQSHQSQHYRGGNPRPSRQGSRDGSSSDLPMGSKRGPSVDEEEEWRVAGQPSSSSSSSATAPRTTGREQTRSASSRNPSASSSRAYDSDWRAPRQAGSSRDGTDDDSSRRDHAPSPERRATKLMSSPSAPPLGSAGTDAGSPK